MYARFRDIKKGPQSNARGLQNRSSTMAKQRFSQNLAFFELPCFLRLSPQVRAISGGQKGTPKQRARPSES